MNEYCTWPPGTCYPSKLTLFAGLTCNITLALSAELKVKWCVFALSQVRCRETARHEDFLPSSQENDSSYTEHQLCPSKTQVEENARLEAGGIACFQEADVQCILLPS